MELHNEWGFVRKIWCVLCILFLISFLPVCTDDDDDNDNNTNPGEETALDRYVAKPDDNYSYEILDTLTAFGTTTYTLRMVSQKWRNNDDVDRALWEHEMFISSPWDIVSGSGKTAILVIDGGSNGSAGSSEITGALSAAGLLFETTVCLVRQIPNQPLRFSDDAGNPRSEESLLAYTLDKFLVTDDEEWPVHLPMTKAVVRAMDTIQEILKHDNPVEDFIIIGGSKRGWITWLTAAVDKRVRAIVPASIDLLNTDVQMDHHWEAYGFYSSAIADYAAYDLFCRAKSTEGRELYRTIDPYYYRDRITIPKYIINSTGDQFFLPDSSQFYFHDLPGSNFLRYSVNTDHLQASLDVLQQAISWVRYILNGGSGPRFSWHISQDGSIIVETIDKPETVKLWQATNPDSRDFRLETIGEAWTGTVLDNTGNGIYTGHCSPPAQGWTAFLVELTYDAGDIIPATNLVYTTDVMVLPETMPFEGTHCE